jgi:signal transduction histidine kinase
MLNRARNRILALNMILTGVLLAVMFTVIYSAMSVSRYNDEHQRLSEAVSLGTTYKTGYDTQTEDPGYDYAEPPLPSIVATDQPSGTIVPTNYVVMTLDNSNEVLHVSAFISLTTSEGNELAQRALSSPPGDQIYFKDRYWLFSTMSSGTVSSAEYSTGTTSSTTVTYLVNPSVQYLTFLDITQTVQTLDELRLLFVLAGVGMLVVIFGISLLFANRSIRPLKQAWEQQARFITDASHELRTPLAIIKSHTDVLKENVDKTVDSQMQWVNHIRDEVTGMTRLTNDLLLLARPQQDGDPSDASLSKPFDLGATVEGVIVTMEALAFERTIQLDRVIAAGEDLTLIADEHRVKRLVVILLDNALKYTNEGGSIEVAVTRDKHVLTLTVSNTGPGIPAANLPHVFDRFYRVDPARTPDASTAPTGYGLGLAVARDIVDSMGVTIEATSEEGTLTVFTVRFR